MRQNLEDHLCVLCGQTKLLFANNVMCEPKISNRTAFNTCIQSSEIKILDYNEEK